MELCGTAIVFWGDLEDRGIEKTEDLDDVQGDCNKERYLQRVVLLEQGTAIHARTLQNSLVNITKYVVTVTKLFGSRLPVSILLTNTVGCR